MVKKKQAKATSQTASYTSEAYTRQKMIFNPEDHKDLRIAIVGVGGIGSNVAFSLAKTGFMNLTLIDMDTVSVENLGSQLYKKEQIDQPKVSALASNLREYVPHINVEEIEDFANFDTEVECDVLILALDSLAARKSVFQSPSAKNAKYVIDARMGATAASFYCITKETSKGELTEYSVSLNRKPAQLPCAGRAIAFTVHIIAGIITSMVRNLCTGKTVPFEQYFDMENFEHVKVQSPSTPVIQTQHDSATKPVSTKRGKSGKVASRES